MGHPATPRSQMDHARYRLPGRTAVTFQALGIFWPTYALHCVALRCTFLRPWPCMHCQRRHRRSSRWNRPTEPLAVSNIDSIWTPRSGRVILDALYLCGTTNERLLSSPARRLAASCNLPLICSARRLFLQIGCVFLGNLIVNQLNLLRILYNLI